MPGVPNICLRLIRLGAVLAVLALALLLALRVFTGQGAPVVTTDKADYYSGETVTVTGTGFAANTSYDIPITRPNGSIVKGDGTFTQGWDSVQSNGAGNFTYYYQLDGIIGAYLVEVFPTPWGGPSSGETPVASTTFTDADINFTQCLNDSDDNGTADNCDWGTGAINANNSIYTEGDAVPQRLFHRVGVPGTYTFAFEYDYSKGDIYAYDFLTNVDDTQLGALLNECGGLPGFVSAAQCSTMFTTNAQMAMIPSDPFDSVSSRENPAGVGARNMKVGCSTACTAGVTVAFPDPSIGPSDGEAGEAHSPDSDPDCFKNCGTSTVLVTVTVTTTVSSTRVGIWYAGHLAEAADPSGPAIGWGSGCGALDCGASSISGAPFHMKYTCLKEPEYSTCDSVGSRDNQIQIGAVVVPGSITIIKDAVPDDAQDFSFTGSLGNFSLDDDADGTLPNSTTFTSLTPNGWPVTESSIPATWSLTSIVCVDPDGGTTVNLGTATANIDLDSGENVTCTFTNSQEVPDVEKISVTAYGADCASPAPASITVSQDTTICLRGQLRYNTGTPASVTVTDTLTATPPPDCTASVPSIANQTLPKNVIVTVDTLVTIHCYQPSSHSFSFQNCIAITPPPTPAETNTANNCASTSVSVSALSTVDVKVTGVSVSAPGSFSVGSPFSVTASATVHNNGAYGPVNADTTLTLSLPGDCTTSSTNPQTIQDSSLAVSIVTTVPAVPASWSVTCTSPSSHSFSVAAAAAIDQLHVSDSNSGNNSGSGSAGTNITTTADVKVTGVSVSAPASEGAGTPFSVTSNATIHNNGTYGPVNVDTTLTLSLPADCTTTSTNPQTVQNSSLAVSTATTVPASPASWSVTCTSPSSHSFSVTAAAAIDQVHVSDSNSSNNAGSGSASTSITTTTDAKVTGVSVSAPASESAGTPFNVTVTATLHNNGPYTPVTADATLDLSLPGDCSKSPTGAQSATGQSLAQSTATPVSKTWSVTCTSPSAHSFSGSGSVAVNQLHVSDSNSGNNSGSGSASTNITTAADVKVTGVTVVAPSSIAINAPFNVTASATLHNNGPYGPVNVDTTFTLSAPLDCTVFSPNPQTVQDASLTVSTATTVPATPVTWQVSCASPSSHGFSVSASAAVDQIHVTDPSSGNNANTGGATTSITALSDLKMTSASATAPSSIAINTPFTVTGSATIHNNGPYGPTNADTSLTLSLPVDCTTTSTNPVVVQDTSLSISSPVTVPASPASWSVSCSSPSNHQFTVNGCTSIDQAHVSDPNTCSNSASANAFTTVTAATDLKVTGVSAIAPGSVSINTPFTVTGSATIHNNGPYTSVTANTTLTLTLPPDCSTTSSNPVSVQNTSLSTSVAVTVPASPVSWSVTCSSPSTHGFTVTASVAGNATHVVDTNAANDSGSGSANTNVLATSDVKVTGVSVSAPGSANTGTPFNVSVTATLHNNGTYGPVNADATLGLSLPPDCSNSPTGSQSAAGQSLAQSTAALVTKTWSVTCTEPSSHQFGGSGSVAINQLHVSDSNSGNNSGTGNGSTNVLATADVKVSGVSVSAPGSANTGAPFNVTVTATLHNNGPYTPVTADATLDLTVPTDCAKSPTGSQSASGQSLAQSAAAPVTKTWSVTCSDPSNHSFDGSGSVAINQLHVSDPNGTNNSGQGSAVTVVGGQADVKVTAVTVSAPPSASAGVSFNVTVDATVHNNGPVTPASADATLDLSVPTDCTRSPNNSQSQAGMSLVQSTASQAQKTWSVTCSDPSNHSFVGSASVSLSALHLGDPNSANNSGSGSGSTNVLAQTDAKVTGVTVSAPASGNTGTAFNVSVTATLHNNGPVTPVNADATVDLSVPTDCTKSPTGSQSASGQSLAQSAATPVTKTWSVTCSSPSAHAFSGSGSVAINQLHVSDSNSGNNSGSGSGTTNVFGQADVKVSGVTVSAPPSGNTGTAFNVSVTATLHNNGPVSPATADATLDLSAPTDCTKSPTGSQSASGQSLAQSAATPVTKTWSVTCSSPSAHAFSGSASAAVNQIHVSDPTPGNNSGSGSGTTNVFGQADAKVSGVTVTAPASGNTGTAFNVTVTATVHNNGPVTPANADMTLDLSTPPDCTKAPNSSQVQQDTSLVQSTAAQIQKTWSVTCSSPSSHQFNGSASVAVDQLHLSDPTAGNNSGQGNGSTNVFGQADVKVSSVTVNAPATASANTPFSIAVNISLHNNGPVTPVNADLAVDLTVPPDCTPTPVQQLQTGTNLAQSAVTPASKTWSVSCSAGGAHTFTGSATLTVNQVHVQDPTTANNSGQGTGTTTITVVSTELPFLVKKDFSDNSTASVSVTLSCASGSVVPPGPASASEASPASFMVGGFTGDPSCTATESPVPAGYSSSGTCSALLSAGQCTITNTLIPPTTGQFTVYKDFTDNNTASVTVTLSCASGTPSPASASVSEASPVTFTVSGVTGSPTCTATENPIPAGYNSSGNCSAPLSGGTGQCTITNTLTPPGGGGGTPNPVGGVAGLVDARGAVLPQAERSDAGDNRGVLAAFAASGLFVAAAGIWLSRRRWTG